MKKTRTSNGIVLTALLATLASAPLWGSEYVVLFLLLYCLYLALAEMWNLLAGFAGLLSLGQQAFIGLGGYTVAVLSGYYGLNPWLGVLAAGISALLLGLLVSVFIFRMRGVYFAIGTWLVAETLRLWFSNWSYVNYAAGLFIRPEAHLGTNTLYYAALATAVLSVGGAYAVLRSRIGLGLMAMRDEEEVAETMGVNVLRAKLFCFLTAAFFTGLTAGVVYLFQVFIQPYEAFSIDWTVKLFFIVIIGGIGTLEGPMVGAFIYVLTSQWLSEYGALSTILPGVVAVAVMLAAPGGIMGFLKRKAGIELLSHRRT